MPNILVLYYSRHGSISAMARLVAQGIESIKNCHAVLRTVPAVSTVCESREELIPQQGDIYATTKDLEDCHGLILGSPTRFGTISSSLKYFFDQTSIQWLNGALVNKPAAVFTSASSLHSGYESTLLSMMLPLIHHGMLIIGTPVTKNSFHQTQSSFTPYGASHFAGNNEEPISLEEKWLISNLGKRVARVAIALEKL